MTTTGHLGQRRVAGETPANLGGVTVGDQPVEKDEVGNGARLAHQRQGGRVVGGGGNSVSGLDQRKLDDL